MFNANCPICLEELDAHNTPVAMPCGHMYCLDCATFWFNQSDVPQKCPCGRAFKGDEIIKLWTGADDSQAPCASTSTPRREGTTQGRAALAACNTALQESEPWGQSKALTDALSQCVYIPSLFIICIPLDLNICVGHSSILIQYLRGIWTQARR